MFRRFIIAVLTSATLLACKPQAQNQVEPRLDPSMPRKMIWAWERPEDLRFLDPKEYGAAFLAQTLHLEKETVVPDRRSQPLEVAGGTYLIAVTRIETQKDTLRRPTFDEEMVKHVAALIRGTLELPNVRSLQVDFDATASERTFYRAMMNELRGQMPPDVPLTMTSLASWCTGDAWFNDFPVDEAVPMVFEMGADSEKIRTYLRSGNDWREPLCRGSYGVSLNEGRFAGMKEGRRMYFFKYSAWTKGDLP